jgi:glycosyltransferase involved in cell wall biosynthesis
LVNDFNVKPENIRMVYNGIDTERFAKRNEFARVALRRQLGINDAPVVGIVARLSDVKGHIYLVRAMRAVVDRLPEAVLLIVGEGKMETAIRKLSDELSLLKNIFYIGEVKDTVEPLSAMDIFVMPSLKEGLGLGLMEAMAMGLPVIGSNIGGIRSLIKDGENGILVEPKDPAELSAAILEMINDAGKAARLSANAQVFIRKNFSREKMVSETKEAYRQCLLEFSKN